MNVMTFFTFVFLGSFGLFSGFIAGLLGLGGGLLLVPIFTFFFHLNGFSHTIINHLAVGTALSSIIFTALSSTRTHHSYQAVDWTTVRKMAIGIVVGAWLGAALAHNFSGKILTWGFVSFAIFSAWQIYSNKLPKPHRNLPKLPVLLTVSAAIGMVGSIVGVGGGGMIIPFLLWCNVPLRIAIGTSAALGFPIALGGSAAYIFYGWSVTDLPAGSLGYIYLPALVVVVFTSMLAANIGAKTAHRLPVHILKRIFAILLLFLAAYMALR